MTAMPIAHLSDRAVLHVAGADARPFLQGLLTNDVEALTPETPVYAGLLSPQGKALFEMILHDGGAGGDGGAVLIDVDAGRAEALAKRLSMYKLRRAVTVEPTALKVFAAWGDDAVRRPADPRLAALGARWVAAEGPAGEADSYDAHRLALGVPGSADIGQDELLWLETDADLLNGVSFTKGCYVGQENTARMHHRDKVRRRLVPVRLDGAADTDAVTDAAGRAAGQLRGARDGLGIAHLRIEAADGPLAAGSAAVTVLRPDWLQAAFG
jgi:folate-binding protein YgfZ